MAILTRVHSVVLLQDYKQRDLSVNFFFFNIKIIVPQILSKLQDIYATRSLNSCLSDTFPEIAIQRERETRIYSDIHKGLPFSECMGVTS